MIGVAFVLAGWFVGRVIYGYVHRFAFRLSQEIPIDAHSNQDFPTLLLPLFRLVICALLLAK